LLFMVSACASHGNDIEKQPNTNIVEDSLFVRIGGLPVLTQMVDEFIDEVTTAPKTKRSFEGLNLKTLKKTVTDHLCHLTGGGCIYEGETMFNAHRDAKITEAEFEVFVSMFRDTLNKYVGTREKNELLKILAPMKRDIVTKEKNRRAEARETTN
jgi:hemoglobin